MKRADIEKAKEDEKLRRQRSASGPVRELYNGPASELATLHHAAGNHAIGQLVQAKLNIIQPSDPLEREADQVADQILRMKKPLTPISDSKEGRGVDTPKQVRKKAGSVNATTDSSVSNNFLRDLGPGRPLDTQVRAFMEPRFGQDLSQVRIHNDNNADKKTSAINAKAFTVGRDIVFGQNQYQLHTYEGKHLLSHELVHTIQGGNQIHRSPGPPSKRRPWTKAQLKYWLDQDLREAAKSHRSAVETMFSTSHFKTALWQVQSEEAKGKYRLGMAVLRMINAGVTDVPTSSPAYLAIRNPDNLEPRDLLNQVYRTAQGEVRRLIKEALASPPGKEAVERESSERARREKGYKYIFTDKPNKQDEKFANERERAILEDTAPIVEPPTEIPEEKDVEQNSGAKRRLNARPWFLLVDEKNRAGSVSISVYSRTPLVRNDRGIEDVTEIAFRLENPIIYGQSISIPPIINTGRLGCMNAVPFLVEYELG